MALLRRLRLISPFDILHYSAYFMAIFGMALESTFIEHFNIFDVFSADKQVIVFRIRRFIT